MSYILSNDNRFYVALEQSYGVAAAISASNRIPAVKLTTKQQNEKVQRADKTGSRTFAGYPSGLRIQTSFGLKTYMANWAASSALPPYGPLVSGVSGRSRGAIGGRHGGEYERCIDSSVYGAARVGSRGCGYQRRRNSLCYGGGGRLYDSTECTIFGYSERKRANRPDRDVSDR